MCVVLSGICWSWLQAAKGWRERLSAYQLFDEAANVSFYIYNRIYQSILSLVAFSCQHFCQIGAHPVYLRVKSNATKWLHCIQQQWTNYLFFFISSNHFFIILVKLISEQQHVPVLRVIVYANITILVTRKYNIVLHIYVLVYLTTLLVVRRWSVEWWDY